MKRFFMIAILLLAIGLVVPAAFAQTWYPANQKTVAWNPSTKLTNGSNVPAGDAVKYQVWSKRGTDAAVKVGAEISATQMTVTFSAEGRYLIGAQAVRYPAGETLGQPSGITWSDSADVVAVPTPFGLYYFIVTQDPENLRPLP